jgi:hypothetical protein
MSSLVPNSTCGTARESENRVDWDNVTGKSGHCPSSLKIPLALTRVDGRRCNADVLFSD